MRDVVIWMSVSLLSFSVQESAHLCEALKKIVCSVLVMGHDSLAT